MVHASYHRYIIYDHTHYTRTHTHTHTHTHSNADYSGGEDGVLLFDDETNSFRVYSGGENPDHTHFHDPKQQRDTT